MRLKELAPLKKPRLARCTTGDLPHTRRSEINLLHTMRHKNRKEDALPTRKITAELHLNATQR